MATSQIELVDRARGLADRLAAARPPVKANTLRTLVADFMSSPAPDRSGLLKMLRLLKQGSGGHLERSGNFPDQAQAAIEVLDPFLEESTLEPRELKTLLGWTARLLLVRGEKRRSPMASAGRPKAPRPKRKPKEEERTFRPPDEKLSAVNGSAFAALARMKAKLEEESK